MQAHIQLEIHVQTNPAPLRQRQILLQPLRRIDQPLQLPLRIKPTLMQLIETFGQRRRQRLAKQDVGIRPVLRVEIEKGLVKRH